MSLWQFAQASEPANWLKFTCGPVSESFLCTQRVNKKTADPISSAIRKERGSEFIFFMKGGYRCSQWPPLWHRSRTGRSQKLGIFAVTPVWTFLIFAISYPGYTSVRQITNNSVYVETVFQEPLLRSTCDFNQITD